MTGVRTTTAYANFVKRVKQLERAWVCYRCELDIDPELEYPDPYSWSLEHIKPVDTHPELVYDVDNATGAHLRCNVRHGRSTQDRRTSRQW